MKHNYVASLNCAWLCHFWQNVCFMSLQNITCARHRVHLRFYDKQHNQGSTWCRRCAPELAFWMRPHFVLLPCLCLVFWWLVVNLNVLRWEARHNRECVSNNQVVQSHFCIKHEHNLRSCCPPTNTRAMTHEGTVSCSKSLVYTSVTDKQWTYK